MTMKLLIYEWAFITKEDLYQALRRQGIAFDIFTSGFSPRSDKQREGFRSDLEKALEGKEYDAIFSINFFEDLANAAHDKGILYICWSYDSPALGGAYESRILETNRLFLFDSREVAGHKSIGVPNLYYLPLAVDVGRLNRFRPSPQLQLKYRADVSFVGQLYQSDMDKIFPLFDEYGAGYIAALINTQMNVYNTDLIEELINERVIQRICNERVTKALLENINNNFLHDVEELKSHPFSLFLAKAVTNKERILLLTLLAKYCLVKLYCPGRPELPGVRACGVVDYLDEMPLVFKCSKINLNITLRTIRHGIPQRVIDILGCRGLALTNYQEDLLEYFEDGRDLLIYSSAEEALDKCRYYLAHEKEAERIRQNGYKIVKDKFSYEHQLNKIWELSGLKDRLPKSHV